MEEAINRIQETHDLCGDDHPMIRYTCYHTCKAIAETANMVDVLMDLFIAGGDANKLDPNSRAGAMAKAFRGEREDNPSDRAAEGNGLDIPEGDASD